MPFFDVAPPRSPRSPNSSPVRTRTSHSGRVHPTSVRPRAGSFTTPWGTGRGLGPFSSTLGSRTEPHLPHLLHALPHALRGPLAPPLPPRPPSSRPAAVTTLHIINSNHFDAGYADLTAGVINEYFDVYFPRAAKVQLYAPSSARFAALCSRSLLSLHSVWPAAAGMVNTARSDDVLMLRRCCVGTITPPFPTFTPHSTLHTPQPRNSNKQGRRRAPRHHGSAAQMDDLLLHRLAVHRLPAGHAAPLPRRRGAGQLLRGCQSPGYRVAGLPDQRRARDRRRLDPVVRTATRRCLIIFRPFPTLFSACCHPTV